MIEDIYSDALLSAAAYADWDLLGTVREFEIKAELMDYRGFTEEQYKTFFVGDETKDPIYQVVAFTEDFNGFSATIFKNTDETSADYNQLTVSFRGTDDLIDWSTNISALLGFDNTVTSFIGSQDDLITTFLESAGLVNGGVLQYGINFTGHSLGGYLATMASYKYNTTMGTASTFNGL